MIYEIKYFDGNKYNHNYIVDANDVCEALMCFYDNVDFVKNISCDLISKEEFELCANKDIVFSVKQYREKGDRINLAQEKLKLYYKGESYVEK